MPVLELGEARKIWRFEIRLRTTVHWVPLPPTAEHGIQDQAQNGICSTKARLAGDKILYVMLVDIEWLVTTIPPQSGRSC